MNHQDSSLAESSVLVGLQAWARVQHLLCKNYLCCDKAKNVGNPIAAVELLFEDLSKAERNKRYVIIVSPMVYEGWGLLTCVFGWIGVA